MSVKMVLLLVRDSGAEFASVWPKRYEIEKFIFTILLYDTTSFRIPQIHMSFFVMPFEVLSLRERFITRRAISLVVVVTGDEQPTTKRLRLIDTSHVFPSLPPSPFLGMKTFFVLP